MITALPEQYNITTVATDGDSVTYQSVGGVDTPDYNFSEFTNSIANTTFPWFNNGIGQRLDLREFNLPASFANETVSDFIITQEVPSDSALFSGLTFSTQAYNAAPEPGTPGTPVRRHCTGRSVPQTPAAITEWSKGCGRVLQRHPFGTGFSEMRQPDLSGFMRGEEAKLAFIAAGAASDCAHGTSRFKHR